MAAALLHFCNFATAPSPTALPYKHLAAATLHLGISFLYWSPCCLTSLHCDSLQTRMPTWGTQPASGTGFTAILGSRAPQVSCWPALPCLALPCFAYSGHS